MTRSILTPVAPVIDFGRGGGRSFWKQILPSKQIKYTSKGKTRTLDFTDDKYLRGLVLAHEENAVGQTPFSLADADNKHTMDPERVRGVTTKLAVWDDVPDDVKAQFDGKYTEEDLAGLWGQIDFPTDEAALSVLNNPALPVSARIREDVENGTTHKKYDAAIVHVLGTTDPKITGMAPWAETADLSEYASDDLIDLSNQSYSEDTVGAATTLDFSTLTAEDAVAEIDKLTDEDVLGGKITEADIEAMDDPTVDHFVEKFGHLLEDETQTDPKVKPTIDPKETELSADAQKTIDLANATATQANERARRAEQRVAAAEWKAERTGYEADGIPPHVLDTAEVILSRADDLVIDLSESGADDIDVSGIIRTLVEGYKGTVDLSVENGHEGGEESDAAKALLAKFEKDYPVG